MAVESKLGLYEYCLRQLGAPLINIEIAEEQAYDRIDDALDAFIERHYDGTNEFAMIFPISVTDYKNGYVQLPRNINSISEILTQSDTSNAESMDDIDYNFYREINSNPIQYGSLTYYHISRKWLADASRMFSVQHNWDYNTTSRRFKHFEQLSLPSQYRQLNDTIVNNCTEVLDNAEWIDGNNTANTVSIESDGTFNFSNLYPNKYYTVGLETLTFNVKAGTYTGDIRVSIQDRNNDEINYEIITPTNRWEQYFIETNFDGINNVQDINIVISGDGLSGETIFFTDLTLFKNNKIVLKGYKSIDREDIADLWDDKWIKKYATALIKKNWGSNVKKYSGTQLIGGQEFNGQTLFDEAVTEIEQLEEELISSLEEPMQFYFA